MCKDMRDSSSMKSSTKKTVSMSASSEKDANSSSATSDNKASPSKDCGCSGY